MPVPSPTPEMILADPPSLTPPILQDFPYQAIPFPIYVFSVTRPAYTPNDPTIPHVE